MVIERRLTSACTGRSIHASFELILLAACEAQSVGPPRNTENLIPRSLVTCLLSFNAVRYTLGI
jgi:hypothetical protein